MSQCLACLLAAKMASEWVAVKTASLGQVLKKQGFAPESAAETGHSWAWPCCLKGRPQGLMSVRAPAPLVLIRAFDSKRLAVQQVGLVLQIDLVQQARAVKQRALDRFLVVAHRAYAFHSKRLAVQQVGLVQQGQRFFVTPLTR